MAEMIKIGLGMPFLFLYLGFFWCALGHYIPWFSPVGNNAGFKAILAVFVPVWITVPGQWWCRIPSSFVQNMHIAMVVTIGFWMHAGWPVGSMRTIS